MGHSVVEAERQLWWDSWVAWEKSYGRVPTETERHIFDHAFRTGWRQSDKHYNPPFGKDPAYNGSSR